jgi:prevent-host-death family protein
MEENMKMFLRFGWGVSTESLKKGSRSYGSCGSIAIQMSHIYKEVCMRFANVRMLKTNTAELLQAVEEGEEVVITYHGKPKAVLVRLAAEEPAQKRGKRKQGVLRKTHPFLKLMGTGTDEAADVSSDKYRYVALAAERKR